MRQQNSRHSTHVIQRPPAHAHETDVQRQTQLEAVAASARDQLVLNGTEAEEGLQLKLAELARDLALAQIGRLPALHRRSSSSAQGETRYAPEKPNSNAREINNLPNRVRAVATDSNRQF